MMDSCPLMGPSAPRTPEARSNTPTNMTTASSAKPMCPFCTAKTAARTAPAGLGLYVKQIPSTATSAASR